jgi:hypothetical protein
MTDPPNDYNENSVEDASTAEDRRRIRRLAIERWFADVVEAVEQQKKRSGRTSKTG